MRIKISDNIKQLAPDCRLGYLLVKNVAITGTPLALTREFEGLKQKVAASYNLDALAQTPRIAAVRSMYRRLRFDPSRYRPASEALARRVLQGKDLYFINSAVDVNNFCSLRFLLPFGLYDADQVVGDIVYDLASQGSYQNIAGNEVSTEGKPFLTDQSGVFGNPTSDSRRTAVTLTTRNLLSVIYADAELTEPELSEILDFTGTMLVRFNGGTAAEKHIVRPGD